MIINVRIKNFYSLRDESVLDFAYVPDRKKDAEGMASLLSFESDRFIKVIGLFGGNAAGKSNMIKAIDWCRSFVLNSHLKQSEEPLGYSPFKFCGDEPSEFFIDFVTDGCEYEYSFALLDNKIVKEELYYYPKKRRARIFTRDSNGEYVFGRGLGAGVGEVINSTSSQTLFLSQAASMNRAFARTVVRFFKDQIVIGLPEKSLMERLEEKFSDYKTLLLRGLSVSDSDIVDIDIEKDINGSSRLVTYHRANPKIKFDFHAEESDGTKRLVSLLILLLENIHKGATLMLDEFDLKLHLRLSEFLIDIVQMANNAYNAQLVFTSHNSNLINLKQLRKEQIVLVTKQEDGSSEFSALCDFEGVNDKMDLQKAYLLGRFDGIPYTGNAADLFETEAER